MAEEQRITPPTAAPEQNAKRKKLWQIVGTVGLSFVASFMGAWVFLQTGIVPLDATRTISDNREKIVLQQGEIVSDVFKKVSPSTVTITTQTITSSRSFFNRVSQGAGSGIILSKDGYILTNKHVVPEGANKVTVILADGKQYEDVQVIGRDPTNDLAFIKVNGVNDLTPAQLGDSSQVNPGQQVVAIGNALGIFRNSVTTGIISGVGRPITASDETGANVEQLEDMLQTDAAINQGNSGGPLVNLKGEVIAVNTAVSGDGQSIGFAIPINAAKGMIESVLQKGKLEKAYLGVRFVGLDAELADQLKLSVKEGALVQGGNGEPPVVPQSPAAKIGLRSGDVITKVNGQKITAESGLATKLAQFRPGDKVTLTVLRDGKERNVDVTLEAFPL